MNATDVIMFIVAVSLIMFAVIETLKQILVY